MLNSLGRVQRGCQIIFRLGKTLSLYVYTTICMCESHCKFVYNKSTLGAGERLGPGDKVADDDRCCSDETLVDVVLLLKAQAVD